MRLFRSALCIAGPTAAMLVWGFAAEAQIRTPAGSDPAVLERVAGTAGLTAFAISADGESAAVAVPAPGKQGETELRFYSTGETERRSTRVDGLVRDLLFAIDGSVLFGIVHRARRSGDTHLVQIDPDTLKVRRANRLPVEASDLDHWITARALLIVAPAELRTLLLPELRSGPLFAVDPASHAVVSLGGGSRVLLGHDRGVDLLDLEDRPGIETMPVRETLSTPAPVEALAAAPDGRSALARLADGRLYAIAVDPLRLTAAGSGDAVAAPPVVTAIAGAVAHAEPPPRQREDSRREAERERRTRTPRAPTATPTPRAEPEPTPTPEPPPTERASPPGPQPTPPRDDALRTPPRQVPSPEPDPPPATPRPVPTPAPRDPAPTTAETEGAPQIRGRITGPAAAKVRFVVLRGPDNLLREARRVEPAADGSWRVDGLEAGRYRVQADPGDGGVLVTRPPFLILDLEEGRTLAAPDLEVVRQL